VLRRELPARASRGGATTKLLKLRKKEIMLDKRNVPIGLMAASVSYYATTQVERAFWLPAALVGFLGTVVALRWLAGIETRALRRFYVRAVLIVTAGSPVAAMAAGAGNLTTGLQQGLGLIMLIAVPTGVIMIIKAVLQHQSGDSTWKMEILKGLIMMGAPVIINGLFQLLVGQASPITVALPQF
jgi:hypothetical protein